MACLNQNEEEKNDTEPSQCIVTGGEKKKKKKKQAHINTSPFCQTRKEVDGQNGFHTETWESQV